MLFKNLAQLKELILNHSNFLITTHINPDGDGLGSEQALYHLLKKLNKKAWIYNSDEIPSRYGFLEENTPFFHGNKDVPEVDCVLVVDTFQVERIGKLRFSLKDVTFCFIDHHRFDFLEDDNFYRYMDPSKPAVGVIIYHLLKEFNLPLTKDMALGLYCSIMSDTANFSNATAECHEIVAECLHQGVSPREIRAQLNENKSKGYLHFLSEVLGRVNFYKSMTWVVISYELLQKYQVNQDEASRIINYLMGLEGINIGYVLREESNGKVRVQLRSKDINLTDMAEFFGGGGHPQAVGWLMEKDIKVCEEILFQEFQRVFF